jgi:hypothetical protein
MSEQTSDGGRLAHLATRLSRLSVEHRKDPRQLFSWPAQADDDLPAMSEALLPLYGHPLYAELTDEQRRRLALLEAVNFFSLNITGEQELMAGLALRIERGDAPHLSGYLQHFLEEESAHTVVFTRFCLDYGQGVIASEAGVIASEAKQSPAELTDRFAVLAMTVFPRSYLPGEEEFLFFARVLVFEEIAQEYNQRIAADADVWKLARDINDYHASDEARHIAFGRALVDELWQRTAGGWDADQRKQVGDYLRRYVTTVLRSYVNPDVYRAVGLPLSVRSEVLQTPHWQALCEQSTRRVSLWLQKIGVFS